jgi:hypothetical protein
MEHIFHYRRQRSVTTEGKLSAPLTLKGTAGAIIKQLLNIANSKGSTSVLVGNITEGGQDRQETVNETIAVHLTNVAKRTESIWNVTAENINGLLRMRLNYFPVKDTLIDYLIEEGVNLETQQTGDILIEDGDVFNDILGTGDDAVQEQVLAFQAEDAKSIEEFGLRQTIEQFPGNVESSTIKRNTLEYLRAHKDTIKSINPVLPYIQEVASQLVLNSVLPVRLHSVGFRPSGAMGFDGYAPVRSITIDEIRGRISLIIGTEYE